MENRGGLKLHHIVAKDLPDLWYQTVFDILDHGRQLGKVDKGSFDGGGNKDDAQSRLQYDYFYGEVINPGHGSGTPEIIPEVPMGVAPPVLYGYIYGDKDNPNPYLEYVMTSRKKAGESYTYGERLHKAPLDSYLLSQMLLKNNDIIHSHLNQVDGRIIFEHDGGLYINQVEAIIDTYKKFGPINNQLQLVVERPNDIMLKDPPCLRSIGTRILNDKLHFLPIQFRSWDLWGGLPANLPALQELKAYMAYSIGVEDGGMLVQSQGLHLYDYGKTTILSESFQKHLDALAINGIIDREPRNKSLLFDF